MPESNSQDIYEAAVPSPTETLDEKDPGDATQRNFRYQHAYGVILLLAGAGKKKPYKAIWCEHHEDLLCERDDGRFDGFQIKTRQPEQGYWLLNHEPLQKSIKRFVHLASRFKNQINEFVFVSNAEFSNVSTSAKDHKKLSRSPRPFLKTIHRASSVKDIPKPFDSSFSELKDFCLCSEDELFNTLKQMQLVVGPERKSFDAEIAHNHLSHITECCGLDRVALNQIRDELIQQVYYASSLYSDDPSRHLQYLDTASATHPELLAKRLEVNLVEECVRNFRRIPFRYSPGLSSLKIKSGAGHHTLRQKLEQGGLGRQVRTMQRRTLSAEQTLIELEYVDPEQFKKTLNQLECVVQAECDEAQLQASLKGSPYGDTMLNCVYLRLKRISTEEAEKVEYQSYETLVGIAGLLTEECTVWWSEKFELGAAV